MPKRSRSSLGRDTAAAKRARLERQNESSSEKEERLARLRATAATRRGQERPEERETRLSSLRSAAATRCEQEGPEERETRLSSLQSAAATRRERESPEERGARLEADRQRHAHRVRQQWKENKFSALNYNPLIEYALDKMVAIGEMNIECPHCAALRFKEEPPELCYANGKVKLPPLMEPPEPLYSLLENLHPMSKPFFQQIRSYNCAFQITSFGAKQIIEGRFMPTFKVQGQIYHLVGSLLPAVPGKSEFLQMYFIEDYDVQASRRCNVIPNLDKNLVHALQQMLHSCNRYVTSFRYQVENATNIQDLKLLIHADRKPAEAHRGRFNALTVNEVAVVLVGQEYGGRRDIVFQRRDSKLHRVSETHRSYDALQYPLLLPRGEDGYSIDIPQYNPSTKTYVHNKTVSAAQFDAYRMMVRNGEYNIFLRSSRLAHQYRTDNFAKIESERLQYYRFNQTKPRADSYIHLRDALRENEDVTGVGQMVILPSSFTGMTILNICCTKIGKNISNGEALISLLQKNKVVLQALWKH